MGLIGQDQFGDGLGHDHHFADGAPAATVVGFHQDLGNHRQQALRQETLGLFALFSGQGIDHAINGLDGAGGVQRAEHQVPGLGRRHGHADGVGIAQLADQNDIRVFTHRRAHAFGETGDMSAELALNHLALLAAMDKLDRVFEADDIDHAGAVEQIDHRRQGS